MDAPLSVRQAAPLATARSTVIPRAEAHDIIKQGHHTLGQRSNIGHGRRSQHLLCSIRLVRHQQPAMPDLGHGSPAGVKFDRQGDELEQYGERKQDETAVNEPIGRKNHTQDDQRQAEVGADVAGRHHN